jgi:hypothetical protein
VEELVLYNAAMSDKGAIALAGIFPTMREITKVGLRYEHHDLLPIEYT